MLPDERKSKTSAGWLFPRIYDLSTLRRAWEEIRKKRAGGGIDQISIEDFQRQAEKNLDRLREDLAQGRYVPEPAMRIYVEKSGGEKRPLGLPTVSDKIVQKAVARVIEPFFNRGFLDCSYAYREDKGHRKAIRRVEHHLAEGLLWITSCDIDSFFDTVDHGILMGLIEKKIWEAEVLRLIQLFLKIGVVGSKGYGATELGIGQGNVLSPLFSNIYLHPFDRALRQNGYTHVRYADDYIVLCKTQEEALRAYDYAGRYLERKLKLKLNKSEEKVRHLDQGFVFLGVLYRGNLRTISPEKLQKAKHKLWDLEKRRTWTLQKVVEEINESVESWRYHYGPLEVKDSFKDLDDILQTVLKRMAARSMAAGEISKDRASQILSRVCFLLDANEERRGAIVAKVLSSGTRSVVRASQERKQPTARTEARETGQTSVTRQDDVPVTALASTAQAPLVSPKSEKPAIEKSVRAAVRRKRYKYQKVYLLEQELVLNQPGTFLGKKSQRLLVKQGPKVLKELPIFRLKNVLIANRGISLSSDALRLCLENDVSLSFVDFSGKPFGRLVRPVMDSAECGIEQLRALNDGRWLALAKAFIRGKVRNQWNFIKYLSKYHKEENQEFERAFEAEQARMQNYLETLRQLRWDGEEPGEVRNRLFGIEGQAAAAYWGLIGTILDPEVGFVGRIRMGATDLFNSLLNYGYGILYNRIWAAVVLAGLNPGIGFLHVNAKTRPALILDLIEEFRPQAVDRVIVTMLNRKEPLHMSGGRLSSRTRYRVLDNVMERLHSPTRYRSRSIPLDEVIRLQARAAVQFLLRGKKYRSFIAQW